MVQFELPIYWGRLYAEGHCCCSISNESNVIRSRLCVSGSMLSYPWSQRMHAHCMYVCTYLPTFHSFNILVSSFVGVGSCSTLCLSGISGGEGGEWNMTNRESESVRERRRGRRESRRRRRKRGRGRRSNFLDSLRFWFFCRCGSHCGCFFRRFIVGSRVCQTIVS